MGNDRRCEKALTTRPGERKVIDAEIVSINGVPVARPEPEPEPEQAPRLHRRRKRPPGRRTFSEEDAAVERSQRSSVTSAGDSASLPPSKPAKLDGKEFRGLAARGPGVYEKGPFDDLVEQKATELVQHAADVVRSLLGRK
jgi:hypothetical protein